MCVTLHGQGWGGLETKPALPPPCLQSHWRRFPVPVAEFITGYKHCCFDLEISLSLSAHLHRRRRGDLKCVLWISCLFHHRVVLQFVASREERCSVTETMQHLAREAVCLSLKMKPAVGFTRVGSHFSTQSAVISDDSACLLTLLILCLRECA